MTKNSFAISTHCVVGVDPAVHLPLFSRYGFTTVELNLGYWPWLTDDAAFTRIRKMVVDSGLSIWAYHMPYGAMMSAGNIDPAHPDPAVRKATVAAVALCLDRLADLGGRRLVIHPNAIHLKPDQRAQSLELCIQTLQECTDALQAMVRRRPEAREIMLAIEPMPPWGLLNRPDEVEEMFGTLDPRFAGLCLDVNHINLAGQNPLEYVRRIGSRVCTTHLSDNDGLDERHWAPATGVLPWAGLLAGLKGCEYYGPLVFETGQFGSDAEDTVARLAGIRQKLQDGNLVAETTGHP